MDMIMMSSSHCTANTRCC